MVDIEKSGNSELLWCSFLIEKNSILLGCVYRPPNSNEMEDLDLLDNIIRGINYYKTNEHKELIMVGDFNLPLINWEINVSNYGENHFGSRFVDLLLDNGLVQLVKDDTRMRGSSSSLLDLAIVSNKFLINEIVKFEPISTSDHIVIGIFINHQVQFNKSILNDGDGFYYDYSEINFAKLAVALDQIGIGNIDLNVKNFENTYERIICQIVQTINLYAKKKNRKLIHGDYYIKSKKNRWMNDEILYLINLKKECFKKYRYNKCEENYNLYKIARNRVNTMIIKAKKIYELEVIEKSKIDINYLYKFLNNNNRFVPTNIDKILIDNKEITDSFDIANPFGEFYTEQHKKGSSYDLKFEMKLIIDNVELVTIEEVEQIIFSLKSSFSVGTDISYFVIKNCYSFFVNFIVVFVNFSLSNGLLPRDWKTGLITPKFKKTNRFLINSYRPITNLNCISKIVEKVILNRLNRHIERLNILGNHQHGYRKGRSTQTNLLCALESWTKVRDEGKQVSVLYTDFSSAFDTIDHNLLLNKIHSLNFDFYIIKWLYAYLSNRHIYVKVDGTISRLFVSTIGIPQGAVLSATLFNLFVADAQTGIGCNMLSYADDFKLFRSVDNIGDCMNFQRDIDQFVEWSESSGLKLNISKCVILDIGTKVVGYRYLINDVSIKHVDFCKDLGVIVDKRLSFSKHCDMLISSIKKKGAIIFRNFSFIDTELFKKLFNIYIQPVLDYCSLVYSFTNKGDIERLNKCFRGLTKKIKCLSFYSYDIRLSRVKMHTPQQRKVRYDLLFTFKMIESNNSDLMLYDYDKTRGNGRKITRLSHKTCVRACYYSCRIVQWWNRLPYDIVQSENFEKFKLLLDNFLNRNTEFRMLI